MIHRLLLAGASALAIATAAPAFAEDATHTFDIPAQPLSSALLAYSHQTDIPVIASMDLLAGKTAPAVKGDMAEGQALAMLLQGTGLKAERGPTGSIVVERIAADPQSGSAAGDGADAGTVAALVVTAQKREENIQDVPIAISAFTQKSLEEQKIEGGFDLLKAIPNVTFSKNNFSSYNFSIRGIGTKAVSVTTDPGVAVAFNNTALIRNRLFEQEYFDVERVEVLRGPQGTLYGRNATAGVINVISAKPNLQDFSGWLKGEVGNYHTKRVSAMVNVPLVEDKLAIRFAGALTDRAGYDYNSVTKHHINGRDLWSARVTVGFNPTDRIRSNLIWERFNEDDDRSRTGKQLCHRDEGVRQIAGVTLSDFDAAKMSQGCKPGSLYDAGAFETPNGISIPFIQFMAAANMSPAPSMPLLMPTDPYGGLMQSPDLRTIASIKDPRYRAKADVFELNFDLDLTPELTLTSQTAYNVDRIYSIQDYNRFNSFPVFRDTSDPAWDCFAQNWAGECIDFSSYAPGGYFTDPQIGTSNTIAGFDLSRATSKQFSQEVRVQSDFSGRLNFSVGANFMRYKTEEDYFVLFNLITATAEYMNAAGNYSTCNQGAIGLDGPLNGPIDSPNCIYIDQNPLESIAGDGHNYFRSDNPYRMTSGAAFGEAYWKVSPDFKITAGLRFTRDRKKFTPVPSQLLLSQRLLWGGAVDRGYPHDPNINQSWGALTGRIGFDWQPVVPFTDRTMIYAFFSHGYKGGGANPPGIGFRDEPVDFFGWEVPPFFQTLSYPKVYEPEFVNAYEVGTKNTLLGGALTFNTAAFFYDYKNYQVSQIKERTAVNENFDAKVWGLELESLFSPAPSLRLNASLGYQDSAIADGEASIDLMNRTQGNPDWVLLKPWVQLPSNCIAPRNLVELYVAQQPGGNLFPLANLCPGSWFSVGVGNPTAGSGGGLTWLGVPVDQSTWPNGSAGFDADLGGNKLPNAPHWTVSLGAQYGFEFLPGWRGTVRADGYWQSQSWARVYNDNPYDKLHGWYNANLSLWVENDDGLKIELYAKNILDKTPITDAFLNSDDTGLTTNVFVLDPRLIGLSIRKDF
ncbi:MAG: TonB-dependent receptor domain-containing protein [Parcubacteria group bacterium]